MFEHLLVPLDGSSRAEQALPLAAFIARHSSGTITLVRAVSPELAYARAAWLSGLQTTLLREAQAYLERMKDSEVLAGIALRTQVVCEPPAQAILSLTHAQRVDLIVLCSHGSSGLTRWALGSVAQHMARHSSVPVLVLREIENTALLLRHEPGHGLRALVAVDGSPFAEAALVPTAELASLFSTAEASGELHLLQVIKPPSDPEERGYLKSTIDLRQFQLAQAEQYLTTLTYRLKHELAPGLHLRVTSAFVEEADPAAALVRIAEGQAAGGYDLLALATHGRSGLKHLLLGSIAERVLQETRRPFLVVRPGEPAAGE